jgi:hypothetical protein
MAIARAMCEVDAENRAILKPEGLLTRDPRMVERKKFGQKKRVRDSSSLNVNIVLSLARLYQVRKFKNNVVVAYRVGISLASK